MTCAAHVRCACSKLSIHVVFSPRGGRTVLQREESQLVKMTPKTIGPAGSWSVNFERNGQVCLPTVEYFQNGQMNFPPVHVQVWIRRLAMLSHSQQLPWLHLFPPCWLQHYCNGTSDVDNCSDSSCSITDSTTGVIADLYRISQVQWCSISVYL